MRVARPSCLLLAVLLTALLSSPAAVAEPPFRVPGYLTDRAGALSPTGTATVDDALERLYTERRVRLWVVFVDTFGGPALQWGRTTQSLSDFGDRDALFAVATRDRSYFYLVPPSALSQAQAGAVQADAIEPALRGNDYAGAAVAAADGIARRDAASGSPGSVSPLSWVVLAALLAAIGVAVLGLLVWARIRRRRRRAAEFAAARRLDPSDPQALATVSLDALDDLSRAIVVDVDNAVRTSDSELALAVEEFGPSQTEPFRRALDGARTALAQAFTVRQTLDDAVPETPLQRRDLLTRLIVAAARADAELDAQSDAFDALRDLVITAPTRLDGLTQQLVELTARLGPAEQQVAALRKQFAPTALASVADNVTTARQRLGYADQNISTGRALIARPAGQQTGLVDAVRAAESSLTQARSLLDGIDSVGADINRAIADMPAALTDIQSGIDSATTQLQQPDTPRRAELDAARAAASAAADDARRTGDADPLGAATRLSAADADLDQLLAGVAEEREARERLARAYEQALFTAQSRVRGVSDFIDTRRGSVGAEARTRLAEAVRQLQAAQDKRATNLGEAIAHANGASTLAARAQTLANDDVRSGQRTYTSWDGAPGRGGSDMGAVIGGVIIGNILGGALRGGFGGGFGGGGALGRPTSFGGSSRSSSRDYSGGAGRF